MKHMKQRLSDTPPHIQKIIIQGYRQMPPYQKLARVRELTHMVQQLALARIQK